MSQRVSPGTGSNWFFILIQSFFVQTQRLWPRFSSWACDFLFWSCMRKSREHILYMYLCHGWGYFLLILRKERRYLLLDRLINVQSPELTAKSIRTGQCPGKVKTSYSQYARNKVIRYFYASIFIRFGHVFVEKKLWKCLVNTFLILKILTRSGCTFIQ